MAKPDRDNPAWRRLTAVRNELLRLHKTLLDSERAAYERDIAPVTSPGHMLQLLVGDPYFTWLRRISELIVEIDERTDEEAPATAADVERFLVATRALLLPAENGEEFGRRYFQAMQRDPGIVIAHGRMVTVMNEVD
jgi:hypothetical protein